MYSKDEVRESTLKYFNGDELATNVWISKYALKDAQGNLLEKTPLDMHRRLTKEFKRIEDRYDNPLNEEDIMRLLDGFKYFVPGGSVLYGVGNDSSISSLGNCFVIGNEADSYGGIMQTDQEQVQLMKRRGGVGHDISHLRPAGSLVSNSAGSSTGAISFMPRYSHSTREVAQDGRRGALMLTIDVNHPDASKFMVSKDDTTKITGANISVKIDDKFMETIENKEFYAQIGEDSNKLWNKLIHQAWKNAEPGVLFWDTITRESPADCYPGFKSKSTNPCGEVPLSPYDSCRLGSMNLFSYVIDPFTSKARFDEEMFARDVQAAQKIMDDIIDLESEKIDKILDKIESDTEPEEIKRVEHNLWVKIKTTLLQGRRTGLGKLGLGDAMAALGYKYDSDEGIDFAEKVARLLAINAYKSSIDMAVDRGSFPVWDLQKEKNNPFINRIDDAMVEHALDYRLKFSKTGRRNIALLAIAPTGTLALMTQTTSGIEPVFMPVYKRRRKVNPDHPNITFRDDNGDCWEEYEVYHHKYKQWFDATEHYYSDSPNKETSDMFKIRSPYHGSAANEIDPLKKVEMQGRIQKWIDHSISVTHNLPKETTEEEVAAIYEAAWRAGCKGVTIYRDGSRDGVLIDKDSNKTSTFKLNDAPKRPRELPCDIFYPTAHGKQYIVTVSIMDEYPYEVFAFEVDKKMKEKQGIMKKVKRGRYDLLDLNNNVLVEDVTSEMSQIEEDRTRLISWGLRHGAGIKFLVEQLSKTQGNGFQDFSKVIARTLKTYIKDKEKVTGATCQECNSTDLIYVDGCVTCNSCGNSKCS